MIWLVIVLGLAGVAAWGVCGMRSAFESMLLAIVSGRDPQQISFWSVVWIILHGPLKR